MSKRFSDFPTSANGTKKVSVFECKQKLSISSSLLAASPPLDSADRRKIELILKIEIENELETRIFLLQLQGEATKSYINAQDLFKMSHGQVLQRGLPKIPLSGTQEILRDFQGLRPWSGLL